MPTEWTKLVIGMVAAMLVAAISTSTMGSAFAQARLGQIARDGLTNRYEPPQSETDFQLSLHMLAADDCPIAQMDGLSPVSSMGFRSYDTAPSHS